MGVTALVGLGLCINAYLSDESPTAFAWTLVAIPATYYLVLLALVLLFAEKEPGWTAEDELADQKHKLKYATDRLNEKLEVRDGLTMKIRFGSDEVGILSMLTHDMFYFMTDLEPDVDDATIDQQILNWFKNSHDLDVTVKPHSSDFGRWRIVELVDGNER